MKRKRRNNKIKIAGILKEAPKMILDAPEFERRIFETKIVAARKSNTEDVLILQFAGSTVNEEDIEKMTKGQAVMIYGSVQTENEPVIVPTAPHVKIFIKAHKVKLLEKIKKMTNEAKLHGRICKEPVIRTTPTGIKIADLMVAVANGKNANFIPCICWHNVAEAVEQLKKGDRVEIVGRFQSREYKKKIAADAPLYLMTAYEISVTQLKAIIEEMEEETEEPETTEE